MRAIPYLLYLLLIALHQVVFKDVTGIVTASLNLTALLVLAVALYKTELVAMWFGFAAGLVMAAGAPSLVGWQAIFLGAIGLAAFHIKERLNLDSLTAKLLLVFGGVLAHNILTLILGGADGFLFLLWSAALAGAVYTTLIGLVFFLFKEGRVTYARIRELF